MSHIMGWFLESVIRKKPDQGSSEENVPVQLDKDKLTSGSSKTKQKNKKAEEPVFSTNLKIPIEDVIKDSISEEKPVSPKKKGKSRTSTLPQENKKSSQDKKIQSEDSVGYSFFKAESTQVKSEQKSSDKKTSKPKDSVTLDNKPIESGVPNDDIGFSFLPVKEKGKSSKKSSPETKDTVRKIEDVPKPPVLDHHKKKLTQQSFTEKPVVLPKKTICTIEKPQKKPVVYSSEEKSLLQEFKESKKVSSSVSYASVLTNTSPETDSNVEINLKVEEKEEKDNKNIDIDVEIKSDAIAKSTCNIVETEKEFETDAVLVSSKIHTENSSLSNSSSIEIISDDKYIDFQSSFENQSQFEDIEENLNKLVEFVPDLDTAFIVEELSTTEEISAEALSQSTSDSKIQPFSAGGSPETELGYNKIVETEPEVQAIADTTLTKEFKPYFKEEKDLGSKENFNISEDKVNETLLDSKNSSSTKNNDLTTTKLFKESEQLKEEPTPQEIEKVVPHELVEVKQIVPKSSSIDHQQNHSDIKLSDNFLDLQLLERHLEVSDEHNLLTDVTDKVIAQKIPVKKSDYLQEQSASFINEEKCVKKFSYITTEVDENKPLEMATSQMRVLTLNNQEHQECTLYRIEKNWIIQFRLGPSLFGRKVYLYCNYPIESKVKFDREQYQLLDWNLDEGCKNADDTAAYAQIVAKLAGSFHYYFTFEKGHNAARQGSGFFLVDPILKYGNNQDLPLDCIQCQTIISKGLGSFSTWEKKLLVAKETGYNMIHFTPIQELGASNSAYSLSEQLKFNHVFKKENGKMPTFEEIKQLMAKMRKEWKVTSICDIVLNHTANESEWIKVHPEVTYNCVNCPYMRPAYLLDAAFHQFSMDVKKGLYEDKGIPIEIEDEEHLNAIRYHFPTSVLELLKIPELYICDASKLAAEFSSLARITPPVTRNLKTEMEELKIFQDQEYRRLASTVDMKLALRLYNVYRNDTFDEDTRIKKCTEEFKSKLDSLNKSIIEEVNDHLTCALDNVIAGIRYFRVQPDGPRVKEITIKNPLVYRYFTDYGTPTSIKEHEEIMYSNKGKFVMAHNGWVMNSDPLRNFAAPDSNVYIRRELIAWGDSVKLRFGDKPEDCPFLWEHMRKYVEQTAEIFDGVRLDNCHSTPIPVAEYLLDCARRVRPDLYVVAELFTNSDMTDNIFVNRLGITSLIREAMSAWDSHEEGRLVYRYGGSPVGSFYQPRVRPLVPTVAHALFLDLTHDNPSPVEKRSVFDLLPSTALVNMACCASGSNRGYDELVPHHIHVVDEIRQYTEWTDDENLAMGNLRYVTNKTGIIAAKRAINDLHFTLGKEGYNQVYVDQMDPDIVAVTRHRPDTHESYILVAFTAFGHPNEDAANYQRGIKSLRFEGVLNEIVLEATLSHVNTKNGRSKFARWENFVKDSKYINGLSEYCVTIKQHIQAHESDIFEKVDSGTLNVTQLNFKNFKPGSVVIVKSSLPESMKDAIKSVRALIDTFSLTKETELTPIIDKLTLADLNRIIYRCDQEERDEGFGYDTYNIPNFGSLVYAGLQGFISLLANIRPNNDLGHPMCANLRDGNWMIEYVWKRLKLDVGTKELGQWIEENTKCFNNIPRYLVPSYFDVVITGIYVLLLEQSYKLMSKFVNHGSTFVKGLSLGSVQFSAYIKSADLPNLSPNLAPPKPPTRKNDKGETVQACVTLSAGLPHFSVGYMRNWGRDTFIALRGLFILTGRFEEARQHILGYAACLRHGLIPNLLDGGRNPRFNCRDAVWWWLYCIKEYVEEAPKGINILSDKVSRIFPTDDSPAQPAGAVDQVLRDVMQETLKVHFQGLAFRERNGRQIDEHMTDRGFNNQIGVHPETGFVFGGNEWNCGTWMDKMGSSDKAGNRGKPATPRDGSAVELIGLSKAVVTWLWKLSQEKKYPYSGVERTHKSGSVTKWTFKEWSDKIQTSFEKYFWVNDTPVSGEFRPDLINKRGIYKDSYGATQPWTDFQLRCNFPIAMVVAPELFTPQRAWIALKQAEKYLLGPLGMKTLDPEDWTYRGDYDNSNDSNDVTVAHGFNYHQGPEWVWPVGFFLRAKLHFASSNGALHETLASTKLVLSKHFTELQSSVWRGLPELTNSNGLYCRDSSRTQAWSMSCILEVLHDLQKIESNQPVLIN